MSARSGSASGRSRRRAGSDARLDAARLARGERALEVRAGRRAPPPPLYLDWDSWLPIHRAYEERRPSYFATPATSLVMALEAGLGVAGDTC